VSALHPDLLIRARAAQKDGFTVVEVGEQHFLAARMKWHWDCFVRLFTFVGVRRVEHCTVKDLARGQESLAEAVLRHDWSRVPRGFMYGRALIDVVLAESADDAAVSYAKNHVSKGFGQAGHTVLVLPTGEMIAPKPFFGAAYFPKVEHSMKTVAMLAHEPEPNAPLGMAIGWLYFAPLVAALVLSCCGIPAALGWLVVKGEQPAVDQLPG
jgi:hypothetical protein